MPPALHHSLAFEHDWNLLDAGPSIRPYVFYRTPRSTIITEDEQLAGPYETSPEIAIATCNRICRNR